ncbi:DMT family transporter [Kaistia geumhonensis]|uniref:Drug/metabolite transporter (DMT)-like permease n=1 Tax=Kaistia geumhonensis TaxID=410839 RepID=A0ABU0M1J9_9HYPH|nr:DMT family transporter [Kaistia geumhonensis]MCX5479946.1 DMT family transporter [Kaistia geumhonensis]MDQ0514826.1 drug/metabolite transporter (DMT)-like permease [Kaistia geumhonensis]
MSSFEANLRGIGYLLLSILAFILNDTMIKVVSERLPIGEIIVLRGAVALVLILALLFATGGHRAWRLAGNRLVAWRTIGEVGGTILYLYALFHMPIANASAISQIVPLMTTAAAAVFLREQVGWRRWMAIGLGFVGVMIIMRPGLGGFDVYAFAALASMAFVTLRDLVTRSFPPGMPTLLVTAVTAGAVLVAGLAMSFDEVWLMPTLDEMLLLGGAAFLLLIGYGTVILAMRHGEMGVIAPFRYAVILFAIALGYLVWGDIPDIYTITGTVIVVATGLYTIHRERLRAEESRTRR